MLVVLRSSNGLAIPYPAAMASLFLFEISFIARHATTHLAIHSPNSSWGLGLRDCSAAPMSQSSRAAIRAALDGNSAYDLLRRERPAGHPDSVHPPRWVLFGQFAGGLVLFYWTRPRVGTRKHIEAPTALYWMPH